MFVGSLELSSNHKNDLSMNRWLSYTLIRAMTLNTKRAQIRYRTHLVHARWNKLLVCKAVIEVQLGSNTFKHAVQWNSHVGHMFNNFMVAKDV